PDDPQGEEDRRQRRQAGEGENRPLPPLPLRRRLFLPSLAHVARTLRQDKTTMLGARPGHWQAPGDFETEMDAPAAATDLPTHADGARPLLVRDPDRASPNLRGALRLALRDRPAAPGLDVEIGTPVSGPGRPRSLRPAGGGARGGASPGRVAGGRCARRDPDARARSPRAARPLLRRPRGAARPARPRRQAPDPGRGAPRRGRETPGA